MVLVVVGEEPFHLARVHAAVGLRHVNGRHAEVGEDVGRHALDRRHVAHPVGEQAGKGQPRLGQRPRARGGIATPGEIDVHPVAELDSTWADPPQVKAADHLPRLPGPQHVSVFAAVLPVCFGLAAAATLRLHDSGFFGSPGQPPPKMIQARADRALAGRRQTLWFATAAHAVRRALQQGLRASWH